MAALVDTNVLVYRYDSRYPEKRKCVRTLLKAGLQRGDLFIPHQAVVEFLAAVTRRRKGGSPILSAADALLKAELLINSFPILYPDETVLRTALRGHATYGLPWFDAHLWAYAERFGLEEIYSEDFEDGRIYGMVRAVNPFTA